MHLFVDNLTNVDFSYLHPERGLVGETWLASVVLQGKLDDQSMVCDFGIVRNTFRQWLDHNIDHRLLVPRNSTRLQMLEEEESGQLRLSWKFQKHAGGSEHIINCRSPKQAIAVIDSDIIDRKSVANWCIEQLSHLLPGAIDHIQLRLEPEAIHNYFYHYSHGLKKHSGNCQRIAHGHRSTIEIHRNGQRDLVLEQQWCQDWQDFYIGTREDLQREERRDEDIYYRFSYTSQQGVFTLALPAQCCYLIDTDSTVECIAQHIADTLKQKYPQQKFKVRAFEGVGKGAIAYA